MNKIKFNINRYKELTDLENSKVDNLEYALVIELLKLRIEVEDQITYNHKNNYLTLIQEYLDKKILFNVFRAEFMALIREDSKKLNNLLQDFEALSNLWIELNIEDFTEPIDDIYDLCLGFCELDGNGMSEEECQKIVDKYIFKLQKYLDK